MIKSTVSERAVIQRINRRMGAEDWPRKLKTARPGTRSEQELGRFFIIDVSRNFILDTGVDLADLAKELKCLAAWEEMAA